MIRQHQIFQTFDSKFRYLIWHSKYSFTKTTSYKINKYWKNMHKFLLCVFKIQTIVLRKGKVLQSTHFLLRMPSDLCARHGLRLVREKSYLVNLMMDPWRQLFNRNDISPQILDCCPNILDKFQKSIFQGIHYRFFQEYRPKSK